MLNEFSKDYISTIGVRISTKILNVEEEEMKLLMWDVAGTSDDEKIPKAYFLGASAAMYVVDLNREETYINVDAKIQELKDISGLDTILLVGNKEDLLSEERIEEIRATCPLSINVITSAKNNDSVEEVFREIVVQSLK